MTRKLNIGLLLLLLIFTGFISYSQTFPVRAVTTLIPPYSVYLSDYSQPANGNNVQLIVTLNEVTRPEYQVKLRLTIEGAGITITTKHDYNPQPIILQGGVPEFFSNDDLAAYFNPDNLEFRGISKQAFLKTGALPDGLYRFCFEVLDYNRGMVVSNAGCATAWILLNDVPILNKPFANEKLRAMEPQNVVLQWTPRHTGSPNSAFNTEYEVTMVEIWPDTRNPNDAMATTPPIFQTTTTSTMLVYGPAETPLEPGRKYAWRVQARDTQGRDLFKNKGYSEVYWFTWGDACNLPLNIAAEPLDSKRFSVSWEATTGQTNYKTRYREAGKAGAAWFEDNSTLTKLTVSQLKPNTEYEYQVMGLCGIAKSEYSPIAKVKTTADTAANFTCSANTISPDLSNTKPLSALKVGDVITAGDFDVKVTKVSGAGGTYSGEGLLVIPFMNHMKVMGEFNNISINEGMIMTKGKINITGAKAQLVDDATREQVAGVLDDIDNAFEQVTGALEDVVGVETVPVDVASIAVLPGGQIEITDKAGNKTTLTYTPGEPKKIQDANGDNYVVNEKGQVGSGGNFNSGTTSSAGPGGKTIDQSLANITFKEAADQQYGFDGYKSPAPALNYQVFPEATGGSPVYIPWKSIESGKTDYIGINISEAAAGFDKSKIQYKSQTGQTYTASSAAGGDLQLTVTGGAPGTLQEIYAYYPTSDTTGKNLAKVNVVPYQSIVNTVYLVPLGTNAKVPTEAAVKEALNKIYAPAVVSWDVKNLEPFNSVNYNGTVEAANSGLLSNYMPQMRQINSEFKGQQATFDNNAYYLFFAEESTDAEVMGFMPRGKQFGYIFTKNNNDILKTIAHELGHGVYHLEHPFDSGQDDDKNLMNYGSGTVLLKYQWDLIHYPDVVIGVLEGDEDGMAVKLGDVKAFLEHIRGARISGLNMRIPKTQIDQQSVWEQTNIILEEKKYSKIKIEFQPLDKDYFFNPVFYKDFSEEEGFVFTTTTHGIVFNASDNFEKIKIYIGSDADKDNLKQYLFGNCDFLEKLNQIHKASSLKRTFNLSYTTDCPKLRILKNTTIDSVLYDEILVYFSDEVVKGTSISIDPTNYKETSTGFDLYENNKKVFTIDYLKGNKDEAIYLANKGKLEKWLFKGSVVYPAPTFPITSEQLQQIFIGTEAERIEKVVTAINKYSNDFGLTTKDKMAHFLAQIGVETAGLKKLTESSNYSAKSIFITFLKVKSGSTHKYCDLIEGYNCSDCSTCPGNNQGPFLCSENPEYYFPTTTNSSGGIVGDYNTWKLTKNVKQSYVNSTSLFDYVYSCRLGNRAKSTSDGSKYKGIGFVHLTGRGTYEEISIAWNKEYPNDKKEFHGDDIDLLKDNIDVAIKASLIYWKMRKINDQINGEDNDVLEVSAKVNLGYYKNTVTKETINGYDHRKEYYKKAKDVL